jgi:very-short-patch-repair endonuclease
MELVTRSELLKRLGTRSALDAAVSNGSWARVFRGTYVRGGDPSDLQVRAAAAQLVLPEQAWVADRFLLWLLGIDVLPPGAPVLEAVVPRLAVVPRRTGMRLRECLVPPHDQDLLGELRILRPLRATADLLRLLPDAERLVVADAVLRSGVPVDALRSELVRHRGLRGVRFAHATLGRADARAESPPESRLRHVLLEGGLDVVPQHDVHGADGRWIARVDLAIPALKIAIEYDGREVHERADVFVNDRRRQNALVAAGWTVLRFSAADLRNPSLVLRAVAAAIAASRAA